MRKAIVLLALACCPAAAGPASVQGLIRFSAQLAPASLATCRVSVRGGSGLGSVASGGPARTLSAALVLDGCPAPARKVCLEIPASGFADPAHGILKSTGAGRVALAVQASEGESPATDFSRGLRLAVRRPHAEFGLKLRLEALPKAAAGPVRATLTYTIDYP